MKNWTVVIYKDGVKTYLNDKMQNTTVKAEAWRMTKKEAMANASKWYGAENASKYVERI